RCRRALCKISRPVPLLRFDIRDVAECLLAIAQSRQVFANRGLDVGEGLVLGGACGPAAGEGRYRDAESLIGAVNGHLVIHGILPSVQYPHLPARSASDVI